MVREARWLKAPATGSDERLLVEAAQRDSSRFGDLYEENFERVYTFIARRVRDREEAEDLTSDVFHRALANIRRFQWRGIPFAAWLLRIAANAISDRARKAARESEIPRLEGLDGPELDGFEQAEQSVRLFRLVEGLPPDQRRVIVLRFAEEKTIREIARELARTEGAVKQLQWRALKNLRARMGESDG